MAMRPHVKRNGLLVIGFAILQCVIIRTIVYNELIELTTNARVALYTTSVIVCATLILLSLIYMVSKGNPENFKD